MGLLRAEEPFDFRLASPDRCSNRTWAARGIIPGEERVNDPTCDRADSVASYGEVDISDSENLPIICGSLCSKRPEVPIVNDFPEPDWPYASTETL